MSDAAASNPTADPAPGAAVELPKAYESQQIEPDVYRRWEEAGCLKAGAGKRSNKTYTIAIPPPNVTGVLHMGHALNNTLQDTLIRWRRMQGYDTLWQPGTDHAGIATESVVAKRIQEDPAFLADLAAMGIVGESAADPAATGTPTGLDRDRFGRAPFLKAVWFWKERSGGQIVHQLRKLGSSCDWSRERFTMDDGLSKAVRTMFVKLHQEGLIYRGTRMVNWCPVQQTALSDDEVEHVEKNGHLWKLRYELSGSPEVRKSGSLEEGDADADAATGGGRYIIVETTRPETFFGDTAVAVNPADPRYAHMIGRKVILPIIGREIPIVGDEHADPTKGSGAVKITPAHDPNDYEVGKRHDLALIRCIGFDGKMTAEAGPYAGQDRFVCRKQLLKDLENQGALVGSTEITHSVGHSYRSGAPIEPMVTEQWFVKMAPLAESAVRETREKRLHFHPERWGKVYEHWLDNVRDWCISRQIWWGHRIPAWHCAACGQITVAATDPSACQHCGSTDIRQDSDVLDTWFSSALWPYSTLGWPDATAEFERYFPTSTLVTDRGIIFFWVARMVMTSLFANDVRPFDDVYIHGTVLDERGDKMSKSKGNGIDPLVMIEGGSQVYLKKTYDCPGYGADAVRYTLLDMTTEGQDLKLSPAKFETGRNFANKVWNAGRFLIQQIQSIPNFSFIGVERLEAYYQTSNQRRTAGESDQHVNDNQMDFPSQWILSRLQHTIIDCEEALENWRFSEYVSSAYRFFRDDLCDWYLEWSKITLRDPQKQEVAASTLYFCLEQCLRILHPGMPFITEYLWQLLRSVTTNCATWSSNTFLMTSEWPTISHAMHGHLESVQSEMQRLQEIVRAVRNVRNQQQLPDSTHLSVVVSAPDDATRSAINAQSEFLKDRANCEILVAVNEPKSKAAITAVVGALKVHVSLQGHVDLDKLKGQLEKRRTQIEKSISGKEGRLGNADYIARAPVEQVAETRAMLEQERVELGNLIETLGGL